MPEILQGRTRKRLSNLRQRAKEGSVKQLKGAFGEPVFIRKSKGDLPPARRELIDRLREREAETTIKKVKKKFQRAII